MTTIPIIITWHNYNSPLVDVLYFIRGQSHDRRGLTVDEVKNLLYTMYEDYSDAKLIVSPHSHTGAVEAVGLEL